MLHEHQEPEITQVHFRGCILRNDQSLIDGQMGSLINVVPQYSLLDDYPLLRRTLKIFETIWKRLTRMGRDLNTFSLYIYIKIKDSANFYIKQKILRRHSKIVKYLKERTVGKDLGILFKLQIAVLVREDSNYRKMMLQESNCASV